MNDGQSSVGLPRYLFFAEMTPGANQREAFDQTYDEHLTQLTSVPGIDIAARAWVADGAVVIGGAEHPLAAPPEAHHVALYGLDDPEVLVSNEWRRAVDAGSWADSTRARTDKRQHRILSVASWWSGGKRLGPDN